MGPHLVEWSYANDNYGVSIIDKSNCKDLKNAFSCEIYDHAKNIKYSGADIQSRPQVRDNQIFSAQMSFNFFGIHVCRL